MVAAGERLELAAARRGQRVRPRRRQARENGQPERAAHHERRVDDAGCQPCLLLRDVTHRREEDRVERHAGADTEQEHAREHVDGERAVDRSAREEQQAERRETEPDAERLADPDTA